MRYAAAMVLCVLVGGCAGKAGFATRQQGPVVRDMSRALVDEKPAFGTVNGRCTLEVKMWATSVEAKSNVVTVSLDDEVCRHATAIITMRDALLEDIRQKARKAAEAAKAEEPKP